MKQTKRTNRIQAGQLRKWMKEWEGIIDGETLIGEFLVVECQGTYRNSVGDYEKIWTITNGVDGVMSGWWTSYLVKSSNVV